MHNRILPLAALAMLGFLTVISGISHADEGAHTAQDAAALPEAAPPQADADPNQAAITEETPATDEVVEPESMPASEE